MKKLLAIICPWPLTKRVLIITGWVLAAVVLNTVLSLTKVATLGLTSPIDLIGMALGISLSWPHRTLKEEEQSADNGKE